MKNALMRYVLMCLLSLAVAGCGTVTPDVVRDNVATADASVPPQYDASAGWILRQRDDGAGVLTDGGRDRYNTLVAAYRLQFEQVYKVKLCHDAGISTWIDEHGNAVWIIDAEHLEYFCRLGRWAKSWRPNDGMIMRAKDAIGMQP